MLYALKTKKRIRVANEVSVEGKRRFRDHKITKFRFSLAAGLFYEHIYVYKML